MDFLPEDYDNFRTHGINLDDYPYKYSYDHRIWTFTSQNMKQGIFTTPVLSPVISPAKSNDFVNDVSEEEYAIFNKNILVCEQRTENSSIESSIESIFCSGNDTPINIIKTYMKTYIKICTRTKNGFEIINPLDADIILFMKKSKKGFTHKYISKMFKNQDDIVLSKLFCQND